MEAVQEFMPNTYIAFSEVLPRSSPDFITGIRKINRWMREQCAERGFGFVPHRRFGCSFKEDRALIGFDGIHLNVAGIRELEGSFTKSVRYMLF